MIDLESFEILALASKPNYDLSSLTLLFPKLRMMKFSGVKLGFRGRGTRVMLPASPFKLVTALGGLLNATLDPNEKLLCEGSYRGMKCHVHPGQHGNLDLREAIAQSCNVYFFRCAERMGHEKLISEARSGNGSKANIGPSFVKRHSDCS